MSAPGLMMPKAFSALARTISVQIISFAIYIFIREEVDFLPLFVCSVIAIIVAKLLRLSLPWQILNAILPLALVWGLTNSLPSWVYLLFAGGALTLFLPAFFSQVPFFPSSPKVIQALAQELPENTDFTFIDVGCGFGEPIFSLAKIKPRGKFVGIDVSPLSVMVGWFRSLLYPNVSIRFSNLWQHRLDQYDFVYAFLAPPPMTSLGDKLVKEPRSNRQVICNTFFIPGWTGIEIKTGDERQHTLFRYER